jgi:fibronectin type 3 domain-containing protein
MKTLVHIGLTLAMTAGTMYADSLALVAADASGYETGVQTALQATGKFSTVDIIDVRTTNPSLTTLLGYTDILAWTNLFPADGVGLGNLLAQFHDHGGKLTIATYALTNPGGIGGTIATGSYAALVDTGNFANPSGSLVATAPNDPVFSGINLGGVTYYHDSGFANASLGTGATLLANDGAGIYMIARSANGVVNVNLYPGYGVGSGTNVNNAEFYNLLANTFPPSAPCITSLTATATSDGKIQLAWPLAGADHYNVYRSTVSGSSYALIGSTNSATSTYLDGAVVPGATYYYVVREATTSNVETCKSNEAHATATGDTIPPTTSITALPAANAKGWNNSNVTLTLTAVDNPGGSGIQQINITLSGAQTGSSSVSGSSATISIGAEGVTTVSYFSTDKAGNAEAPKTIEIMLDKTPPTASATNNPAPNSYGWNDTDVTVTFSGTDSLSGVASCTAPVTLTSNGAGQVVKGLCTDNAGNASAPATATVNINKTAPVIDGVPATGSCVLWSPDNKLVHVATLSVTGWDIGTFDVTATSNEPAKPGRPDIVITGTGLQPREVELRAQRSGDGNARIYTVTAKAWTWSGMTTTETFTCTVPHDQDAKSDGRPETGDQ